MIEIPAEWTTIRAKAGRYPDANSVLDVLWYPGYESEVEIFQRDVVKTVHEATRMKGGAYKGEVPDTVWGTGREWFPDVFATEEGTPTEIASRTGMTPELEAAFMWTGAGLLDEQLRGTARFEMGRVIETAIRDQWREERLLTRLQEIFDARLRAAEAKFANKLTGFVYFQKSWYRPFIRPYGIMVFWYNVLGMAFRQIFAPRVWEWLKAYQSNLPHEMQEAFQNTVKAAKLYEYAWHPINAIRETVKWLRYTGWPLLRDLIKGGGSALGIAAPNLFMAGPASIPLATLGLTILLVAFKSYKTSAPTAREALAAFDNILTEEDLKIYEQVKNEPEIKQLEQDAKAMLDEVVGIEAAIDGLEISQSFAGIEHEPQGISFANVSQPSLADAISKNINALSMSIPNEGVSQIKERLYAKLNKRTTLGASVPISTGEVWDMIDTWPIFALVQGDILARIEENPDADPEETMAEILEARREEVEAIALAQLYVLFYEEPGENAVERAAADAAGSVRTLIESGSLDYKDYESVLSVLYGIELEGEAGGVLADLIAEVEFIVAVLKQPLEEESQSRTIFGDYSLPDYELAFNPPEVRDVD